MSPPQTEGTIVGCCLAFFKWETHWKLYITLFSRLSLECEELKMEKTAPEATGMNPSEAEWIQEVEGERRTECVLEPRRILH